MPNYHFHYDNRSAGAGKTSDQIKRIATTHGLYIFAVDRRESIRERRATLETIAADVGARIHIVEIFSASDQIDGGVHNVRIELEALPRVYHSGHVVAFVTHQALKDAALDEFSGWDLVVDEAPCLWDQAKLTTSVSRSLVDELFWIERGEVANRIASRTKLAQREFQHDTLAGALGGLQSRVRNNHIDVYTFVDDWAELAHDPTWTWYSLWSIRSLCAFRSTTVLAADFDRSLSFRLCRAAAPDIAWSPLPIEQVSSPSKARSITIRYFAEAHVATRYRFDTTAGKSALARIALYLSTQPRPLIWTCNDRDRGIFTQRLNSGYLRPRQAGTNAYAHVDAAAIIYSAKPDDDERSLLKYLGVDPQAVIESREFDTIYQFCARTSVRDRESERAATLFVYDKVQAQVLERALAVQASFQIAVELIDLGFAHDAPKRRDLSCLTPEERAERKRQQARDRKRAQRAGNRSPS